MTDETKAPPASPSVGVEWTGWLIEETWISPMGGGTLYIHRDFRAEKWREECDRVRDIHRRRQPFCTKDANEAMRFRTEAEASAWVALQPRYIRDDGQYQAREHAALTAISASPAKADGTLWSRLQIALDNRPGAGNLIGGKFIADPPATILADDLRAILAMREVGIPTTEQNQRLTPAKVDDEALKFGPDVEGPVNFYEREFYPLSNFSAFTLNWWVSQRDEYVRFDTSEAAYHYEKFICKGRVPTMEQRQIASLIQRAPSAHEAFKIAEANKHLRRKDWDEIKIGVMREIIRAKADQHEYVRRKLMETGDRPLVEGSWRDDFWGIGPNGDGQNMLGKLWMELRLALSRPASPIVEEK